MPEAIGLLLYELDQPARPATIVDLLMKGWRKVAGGTVRAQLTGKGARYILAKYVIKEGDGYRLTEEGLNWVKTVIVPKLASGDTQT